MELVVALAVLAISFSALVLVSFGQRMVALDAELSGQAIHFAKNQLTLTRAEASDFNSIINASSTQQNIFTASLGILDISPCLKLITSSVGYPIADKEKEVSLSTGISWPSEMESLGNDCLSSAPAGNWVAPESHLTIELVDLGIPTDIDVLAGIAYITSNRGLHVVDPATPLTQGFLADGDGFNSLDVARDDSSNKTYAYLARATTTAEQLVIADVTGPDPRLESSRRLNDPAGTGMEGWRVLYYDQKVYVSTRYNAGRPELYVFDVSNQSNPIELGNFNPNTSIYGLAAQKHFVANAPKLFAYLATSHNNKELIVLDVTNPGAISELTGGRTNLPGNKDGRSLFLLGTKIVIGLESGAGDDLFVLDNLDPFAVSTGLPIVSSREIGGTILDTKASANYAFLSRVGRGSQVEIWNLGGAEAATPGSIFPIPGIVGLDIDEDYIYAVGSLRPQLHLIRSD